MKWGWEELRSYCFFLTNIGNLLLSAGRDHELEPRICQVSAIFHSSGPSIACSNGKSATCFSNEREYVTYLFTVHSTHQTIRLQHQSMIFLVGLLILS
jgi:hypothetical protein